MNYKIFILIALMVGVGFSAHILPESLDKVIQKGNNYTFPLIINLDYPENVNVSFEIETSLTGVSFDLDNFTIWGPKTVIGNLSVRTPLSQPQGNYSVFCISNITD